MPPLILGLHGSPSAEPGSDPADQIRSLRIAIDAAAFPADIDCHKWADGGLDAVKLVRKLMAAGKFGRSMVELHKDALDGFVKKHDRVVFVAYSAGGTILYNWLTTTSVSTTNVSAVVIASPHKCTAGAFFIEDDPKKKPRPFIDEGVDLNLVAQRVGRKKLMVLLAANDGTVQHGDAAFEKTYTANGHVLQYIIPHARHKDVCDKPATHNHVCSHVSQHVL